MTREAMTTLFSVLRSRLVVPLMLLMTLGLVPLSGVAEPGIEAAPVVNINQAGPEELAEALHGVGINKAQAIVEDRDRNGPFDSAEALARVPGIGDATVSNNRDRIRTQ